MHPHRDVRREQVPHRLRLRPDDPAGEVVPEGAEGEPPSLSLFFSVLSRRNMNDYKYACEARFNRVRLNESSRKHMVLFHLS